MSIFVAKNHLCVMKDKGIHSSDTSMLAEGGSPFGLEDKMLVMDNLEKNQDSELDEYLKDLDSRLPLKMSSACMLIVVSGAVKFGVNLREFVVEDNSCAIISAGTIIERMDVTPGTRMICLSLSPNKTHQNNIPQLYAMQVTTLRLRPVHVELLRNTYASLRVILTDPELAAGKSEAASRCINLMGSIIAMGVNDQPESVAKTSRRDEIVARFLQCVHENYRERRDLGFYAEQLGLSLKYMSHVVFEQTGRHPSRWIKDYVILDAKTMLRSGRYTVQQVADELNFPNQSFFGKYFKEAVGVSPKKWR